MLHIGRTVRNLDLISVGLIITSLIISLTLFKNYYEDQIFRYKSESVLYREALDRLKVKISVPRYPFATNYERKDYHDYEFIRMEAMRVGPGEQGQKYLLPDQRDIELNNELMRIFGFNVVASDHISVNRSIPDIRLQR